MTKHSVGVIIELDIFTHGKAMSLGIIVNMDILHVDILAQSVFKMFSVR